MKFYAFFLSVLCLTTPSAAQTAQDSVSTNMVSIVTAANAVRDSVARAMIADSIAKAPLTDAGRGVLVHKFDSAKWKQITQNKDFEEQVTSGSAIHLPIVGGWLRFGAYAVVVAFVIFIIYYVMKNVNSAKRIKPSPISPGDIHAIEDIASLDYAALLRQARAQQNYRLAVRIYYLSLLNSLNENKIIVWKRDKTNRDYLREISASAFHFKEILQLTVFYEKTWYGEHNPTLEFFEKFATDMEIVQGHVNQAKPA